MKFIAIFATVAVLASAAHADPVLVPTPKAPFSADQADAYVVSLEEAIKRAGKIVGNYAANGSSLYERAIKGEDFYVEAMPATDAVTA